MVKTVEKNNLFGKFTDQCLHNNLYDDEYSGWPGYISIIYGSLIPSDLTLLMGEVWFSQELCLFSPSIGFSLLPLHAEIL